MCPLSLCLAYPMACSPMNGGAAAAKSTARSRAATLKWHIGWALFPRLFTFTPFGHDQVNKQWVSLT